MGSKYPISKTGHWQLSLESSHASHSLSLDIKLEACLLYWLDCIGDKYKYVTSDLMRVISESSSCSEGYKHWMW